MMSDSHSLRLSPPLPVSAPPRKDLDTVRGILWGAGLGTLIWGALLYAWLA